MPPSAAVRMCALGPDRPLIPRCWRTARGGAGRDGVGPSPGRRAHPGAALASRASRWRGTGRGGSRPGGGCLRLAPATNPRPGRPPPPPGPGRRGLRQGSARATGRESGMRTGPQSVVSFSEPRQRAARRRAAALRAPGWSAPAPPNPSSRPPVPAPAVVELVPASRPPPRAANRVPPRTLARDPRGRHTGGIPDRDAGERGPETEARLRARAPLEGADAQTAQEVPRLLG